MTAKDMIDKYNFNNLNIFIQSSKTTDPVEMSRLHLFVLQNEQLGSDSN